MNCCGGCFEGVTKDPRRRQSSDNDDFEQTLAFISKVPLFRSLPLADHPKLAKAFKLKDYAGGSDVIRQGEDTDAFFVVRRGAAKVFVDGKEVNSLGPGDFFGEMALLYNTKRNATIRADGALQCSMVSREDFNALNLRKKLSFKRRQAAYMGDESTRTSQPVVTSKTPQEKAFIKEAFRINKFIGEYLNGLSEKQLEDISAQAYVLEVPAGTDVIKQGDTKADLFYILQEGAAEALKDGVKVDSYTAGGSFGGLALLYQAARAATVKVTSKSKLWCIPRAALRAVMQQEVKAKVAGYAKLLGKVKMFQDMPKEDIEMVADALLETTYSKGQLVTEQGEDSTAFFILQSGQLCEIENGKQVNILKTENGKELPYFGEKALLEEMPYFSTRQVLTDKATLLVVSRDTFARVVSIAAETSHKIQHQLSGTVRELVEYKKSELETIGLLGCGGFGKVTLERYRSTGQLFAMKAISKGYVVSKGQQKPTMNEKRILRMTSSMFLVQAAAFFNTDQHLFFLLEPVLGGELFTVYMRYELHGKEAPALFYTACVVKGFQHLHERCIVYRDMKPENLLLDEFGYCKIADFGMAKFCVGKTFSTCGTPDYSAPELIKGLGHTTSLDWWTLGVLIYELMTGQPPFAADYPSQTFAKMMKGFDSVRFPSSAKAWPALVRDLCKMEPAERLPVRPGGVKNLEKHAWFTTNRFAWDELLSRKMPAPFLPEVNQKDTSNFESCEDESPPDVRYVNNRTGWDDGFEDVFGPKTFEIS